MSLEKFSKQRRSSHTSISIRRNGSLSISSEAVSSFDLKEMRFVTLHYDRKESILGIKPAADNSDPAVFKVVREKERTAVIFCQSFLTHFGIHYKEGSKSFKPTWDEKAKMILVKIG